MEAFKVVHGVKIFERKCKCCTNTFFVPKSCPQVHCSSFCEGLTLAYNRTKRKKGKRKLGYKLKRSDYET